MLQHRTKINLGIYLAYLLYIIPLTGYAVGQNISILNQQNSVKPQEYRDPFTPSGLMFEIRSKQFAATGVDAYGFMRTPNSAAVPQMRLRGFVTQDEKDPVALLEIAGARTFLVREGDEINIDPSRPSNAIRITKITRLSVTVETGTLGSIRVQR